MNVQSDKFLRKDCYSHAILLPPMLLLLSVVVPAKHHTFEKILGFKVE